MWISQHTPVYFTGHIPCYLRSSRENQELICGYLLIGERIQNFFHGGGGGGGGGVKGIIVFVN